MRLTVPPRTPAAQVDAFLRASRGWVEEQRRPAASAPPRRSPTATGSLTSTTDLDLVVRRDAGGRPRARRHGSALLVTTPPEGGGVDAAVERWYRSEARTLLAARSRALAAEMGARVAAVSVRDPRSRWGSCSRRGRLSYSWRLLLAPERVLDYVVAHEVCHLLRPRPLAGLLGARPRDRSRPPTPRRAAGSATHGRELHRGPAWRAPPAA